jgi:hypothetical protein
VAAPCELPQIAVSSLNCGFSREFARITEANASSFNLKQSAREMLVNASREGFFKADIERARLGFRHLFYSAI